MHKLLERVRKEGNPLIDGERVTFVWEGKTAPYLKGDFNNWGWVESNIEEIRLEKVEKGLWAKTLTFPRDAYLEYHFASEPQGDKTILIDPYNPKTMKTGFDHVNQVLEMPEYRPTPYAEKQSDSKHGIVSKHKINSPFMLGGKREVWLYQPPVKKPVPLLLVYDGKDYYKRAKLPLIVDNLIAAKKIKPIALLMIQHAGKFRSTEYNQSEMLLRAVGEYLIPFAQKHLNIVDYWDYPSAYGVLGASMGGLMSLYTGLRLPSIFGKVISQSGAFFRGTFESEALLLDIMLDKFPKAPLKIWQDVGRYEFLLEDNRRMSANLHAKGYHLTYREYNAGHNYTAWRNMLPDALMTVFGRENK